MIKWCMSYQPGGQEQEQPISVCLWRPLVKQAPPPSGWQSQLPLLQACRRLPGRLAAADANRTIMRRCNRRLRPPEESLHPTRAARALPACTPAEESRSLACSRASRAPSGSLESHVLLQTNTFPQQIEWIHLVHEAVPCTPARLLMSFSTAWTMWVACLQLPRYEMCIFSLTDFDSG